MCVSYIKCPEQANLLGQKLDSLLPRGEGNMGNGGEVITKEYEVSFWGDAKCSKIVLWRWLNIWWCTLNGALCMFW